MVRFDSSSVRALFAVPLLLSACGSRVHHGQEERANRPPLTAASKPRDPSAEPQPEPAAVTPEEDFILRDEPAADPKELLEATKHDCCDEASATEIQAGTLEQPATKFQKQRARSQAR
jgi:hypothetical protein